MWTLINWLVIEKVQEKIQNDNKHRVLREIGVTNAKCYVKAITRNNYKLKEKVNPKNVYFFVTPMKTLY